MKSMSTVQQDWVQVRPISVFKSTVKALEYAQQRADVGTPAWQSLSFHWKKKNHFHTYWLFIFPMKRSKSSEDSNDPEGYIPTWLSRRFHKLSLNRNITGRSGNWQAHSEVSIFPFASLGTVSTEMFLPFDNEETHLLHSLWNSTALKGWRQWFLILAWHQYWCHLGRFEKYWCHPGEEIPV